MEGECWEDAIDEFSRAIDFQPKDERNVWAYGMHFRDEYFPHRERGICYFYLKNFKEAAQELELSINQTPSARAKYYLNQTRRSNLLTTRQDTTTPTIYLDFSEEEYFTNQTPFRIMGTVKDDHFVAAVSMNQSPLFIELAEPAIPFAFSVDLKTGWNTIEVTATDLVDRRNQKDIRIYLDQQGPLVIIDTIQNDQIKDPGQITLAALVYDKSGIISFHLNNREVRRVGLDRLCLIEETLSLTPDIESIFFRTKDRAGNVTEGQISLTPARRRANPALRLACSDLGDSTPYLGGLAVSMEKECILFDISEPPQEDLTTCDQEIYVRGKIKARNGVRRIKIILEGVVETREGIRRIELNARELSKDREIEAFEEENLLELIQELIRQIHDPKKYSKIVKKILEKDTTYYLKQKILLGDQFTTLVLTLVVEDKEGNKKSKQFNIQKKTRQEIFKSEQRMAMAIIPFDVKEDSVDNSDQNYIYNKLLKSFAHQGRFNLIEQGEVPWELIENECRSGKMCTECVAQLIGEMTSAEGIICGNIQKLKTDKNIEIKAEFREVEMGKRYLFHDVYTPHANLNVHIPGLAQKFCNSFPLVTGTIIDKDGHTIRVNLGAEKGLFPGMRYNIFENERELINKANIRKVEEIVSEAEISEKEKNDKIEKGYWVRTR